MARDLFASRDKAAEFNIDTLLNGQAVKQGVLCVSPATWELCYKLLLFYGQWRSRYYYVDPLTGKKMTIEDDEWELVINVYDTAVEEMQMTGCSELAEALGAIAASIAASNEVIAQIALQPGCGCESVGTTIPEEPIEELPPIGPEEDFPTVAAYDVYKCKAANSIVRRIIQSQQLLLDSNVQGYFQAAVAVVTAAVTYALTASGLVTLNQTLGSVSSIVLALISGEELNLEDIITWLEANRTELVCALFCAQHTNNAIADYMDLIQGSDLTETEILYLELYAQPGVFNWLFAYRPELDAEITTVDCGECGCNSVPCGFTFALTGAGGTPAGEGAFRYDGLEFVLSSVVAGGGHSTINFSSPATGEGCGGLVNWCLQVTAYDFDDTTNSFSRTFTCYVDEFTTGQTEYQFETPSAPPLDTGLIVAGVEINNPTPFTVTFRITDQLGFGCTDPEDGC